MAEEKWYLIVNPRGAMHVVSEEHAKARLKIAGWHLATAEEKEAYNKANGNQRFDRLLTEPFKPEPISEEAFTDATFSERVATVIPAETPETVTETVKAAFKKPKTKR